MKSIRLEDVAAVFADEVFEHLSENKDFSAMESSMRQLANQLLCKGIEAGFARFDDALFQIRPKTLRSKGLVSRSVLTLSGNIHLKRRRYIDISTDRTLNLADEVLGIDPHDKVSAQTAWLLANCSIDMTYRKATEVLEFVSGHAVSKTTVKSAAKKTADTLKNAASIHEFSGTRKVESLCCESDGVNIALQQRHLPKKKRKKRNKEVRLAAVYEGKHVNPDKTKSRINKHIVATTATTKALWEDVERHIDRVYDTTHVTRSYLGSDGASWCFKGAGVLPGRVIVGYDLWHVYDIIKRDAKKALSPEVIAILKDKGVDEAVSCVKGYATFYDTQGVDHSLWELCRFFKKYKKMIENARTYNLGTMESTVAHVVGARLKNFGGAWSVCGADAMVTLRAAYASGTTIPLVDSKGHRDDSSSDEQSDRDDGTSKKYRSMYANTIDYYHQAKIAWENESCRIKHNMAQVY